MNTPLLEAIAVGKTYKVGRQTLHAVDQVSLRVYRGETVGLVGESGCGKSSLGRCLLRLQTVSEGAVRFDGVDISTLRLRQLRPMRPRMQMVFQDPYGSLNPRRRVGDLIAEPMRVHPSHAPADIGARVQELLSLTGLKAEHSARYPHEFSGGQRQRIGIARALALNPELIVADEPVSALDVSVQAQIINLMMDLQESLGLTYLFIAHDLAVVRQIATRTAVMYLGSLVELGPTSEVFARPLHPYTAGLLAAVPHLGSGSREKTLRGEIPSPLAPPSGCRFHPRCPRAQARCADERPVLGPLLGPLAQAHQVACHFPLE